ncbi:hypothetical protein PspLS_01173 [Pyricularia sp. CBS 133598]|nr:hypothetical protein PspLS_01173 [Pyricularia sp. CBS 133598]
MAFKTEVPSSNVGFVRDFSRHLPHPGASDNFLKAALDPISIYIINSTRFMGFSLRSKRLHVFREHVAY